MRAPTSRWPSISVALCLAACTPSLRMLARDAGEADAERDAAQTDTAAHDEAAPDAESLDAGEADAEEADAGARDAEPAADAALDASAPACESPGFTRCAERCVDLASDRAHCGRCGLACATGPQQRAECNAGECLPSCEPGYGDCDGEASNGCEVALVTAAHCGACGRACEADQECVAAACVRADSAPPPRQLAPLSGTRTSGRSPEFLWLPVPGGGGAQVQVCRQRACSEVLVTLESEGARAATPAALDPGVYFWRVRSGSAGRYSDRWSPVWQFRVPTRTSALRGAWGVEPDFNGDGVADIAVGAPGYRESAGQVQVFYGVRGGLPRAPSWIFDGADGPRARFGATVFAAGDVNGDGYVDLAVAAPSTALFGGRTLLFFGGPLGLATSPSWVLIGSTGGAQLGEMGASLGDINSDGYADFVLGGVGMAGAQGIVLVYLGGPGATAPPPAQQLRGTSDPGIAHAVFAGGDVNGDGFGDLLLGLRTDTASQVLVYSGSGTELAAMPAQTLDGPRRATLRTGLAGAFDANGDGYADVLLGGGYAAGVALLLGSAAGLQREAAFRDEGCGGEVGAGGDIDGDGFDDAALLCEGVVRVRFGDRSGFAARVVSLNAPMSSTAPRLRVWGDVNGDGFFDVLVGQPSLNGGTGAVRVYLGSREGIATGPAFIARGSAEGERFGDALGGG